MSRDRHPGALRCVLLEAVVAVWLGGGDALAASKLRASAAENGDHLLTVSEDDTRDGTTVTLICSPGEGRYALVLVIGRAPAAGSAQVAIVADGAPLGTREFVKEEEALMLLSDGPGGRELMGRLTAARSALLDVGGRQIRFTLADGKAEVARYRASCRL